MACCINLGIKNSCEPIDTGLIADSTGNFKIAIYWANAVIKQTQSLNSGDAIIINCNLNENAYYKVEVTKPDGSTFDCLEFTTKYTVECSQE